MIRDEQEIQRSIHVRSKRQPDDARVSAISPCGMRSRRLAWLAIWLALSFVQVSSAGTLDLNRFQQLVVFGDSLSDNGNSFVLFQQPPVPPYVQGRWTNGLNWV